MISPPLYALHVDGVGEYAMRRQDGTRCLFLFTNKRTISDFVELMERPEHKEFTAIPFDSVSAIVGLLFEIRSHTQMVAIDPVAYCEFTPVEIDRVIAELQAGQD